MHAKSKMELIALARLLLIVLLAVLLAEYLPLIISHAFANSYEHEVKKVVTLLALFAMAYAGFKFKDEMDRINE